MLFILMLKKLKQFIKHLARNVVVQYFQYNHDYGHGLWERTNINYNFVRMQPPIKKNDNAYCIHKCNKITK